MELGHSLTRSGLTYPEVSLKVFHDSFLDKLLIKYRPVIGTRVSFLINYNFVYLCLKWIRNSRVYFTHFCDIL